MDVIGWVRSRLHEPATWAGLAALILGSDKMGDLANAGFSPEFWSALGVVITSIIAVIKSTKIKQKNILPDETTDRKEGS